MEGNGGLAAPAWLPDPTGRFQYRYWDGKEWTNSVSRDGQATSDAVGQQPAAPTVPEVLTHRTIVYEYAGKNTANGWPVYDGPDRLGTVVGAMKTTASKFNVVTTGGSGGLHKVLYQLVGNDGRVVVAVTTSAFAGNHSIVDGANAELGHVKHLAVLDQKQNWAAIRGQAGPVVLPIQAAAGTIASVAFEATDTAVTSVTVSDSAGQSIATLTQSKAVVDPTVGLRSWFTLQRNDGSDQLGLIVVAVPLLLHVWLTFAARDYVEQQRENGGVLRGSAAPWQPL